MVHRITQYKVFPIHPTPLVSHYMNNYNTENDSTIFVVSPNLSPLSFFTHSFVWLIGQSWPRQAKSFRHYCWQRKTLWHTQYQMFEYVFSSSTHSNSMRWMQLFSFYSKPIISNNTKLLVTHPIVGKHRS